MGVDTRGALGAVAGGGGGGGGLGGFGGVPPPPPPPPARFSGSISYTMYRHGKHLELRPNSDCHQSKTQGYNIIIMIVT